MHHHRSTAARMAIASILLSVVFAVEVYAIRDSGSLVLLTHLADVVGDLGFYLVVLVTAAVSWRLDHLGREHDENHSEEMIAAVASLWLMGLGLLVAAAVSCAELIHPEAVNHISSVLAPIVSVVLYLIIYRFVQNEDKNIAKGIVDAHILGDLLTSLVVVIVSVVVLVWETPLLNPLGALVVLLILALIFRHRLHDYRVEQVKILERDLIWYRQGAVTDTLPIEERRKALLKFAALTVQHWNSPIVNAQIDLFLGINH